MCTMYLDLAEGKFGRQCLRIAGVNRPGFRDALFRRVFTHHVLQELSTYPYAKFYVPLRFVEAVIHVVYNYFDGREVTYSADALEYLKTHCAELKSVCHDPDCSCNACPRVGEPPEAVFAMY